MSDDVIDRSDELSHFGADNTSNVKRRTLKMQGKSLKMFSITE